MMHDSPLHIACKFNAVECVDYLLSHPFCDTTLTNYDKLSPPEVIGERDSKKGAKAEAIRKLFARRFIVPIWRDESVDGEAPVLGEVSYIPDLGQAIPMPLLQKKFPEFSMSLMEPCKPKLMPKNSSGNRMRVFASHQPAWKIMAFAGPMEEKQAREFRTVMKRSKYFLGHMPASADNSFNISASDVFPTSPPSTPKRRTRQSSPGPCTPPRSPSNQLPLSPITSPYSSIRSLLESPRKVSPKSNLAARVRDVDKGLERIAAEYASAMGVPWIEYWKFLGAYCDLTSEEGLEKLEEYLKTIEENQGNETPAPNTTLDAFDDVINKMANMNLDSSGVASPTGKSGYCTNPNCRLESRFCNCEDVVPSVRFCEGNGGVENRWAFGDLSAREIPPFTGMSHPFLGIRRLDATSHTDSFEPSNDDSEEIDSPWQPTTNMEVYQTAPSSPVDNDVFEDCNEGNPVFFSGEVPGKLDFQIFHALKDHDDEIDKDKYLATFQWLSTMHALGDMVGGGYRRNYSDEGTPKRHSVGPGFVSTPVRARRRYESDSSF